MILNEEQTMLKDSAKDFCATNAPIAQLRKLRDDANPDGFDRGTWGSMVELGWAAIPWSEDHGGLAFGYKGLGVVTEESGRTLTASPLYASCLGRWHADQSWWFKRAKGRTVTAVGGGRINVGVGIRRIT
jgi:acyl-CoA dehydrogenase